ncbi:MAG: hypothetical protein HY884_00415 [Deltaproteobacteria bacterium]|nr:hypothetical protein [Deltaproteobacteria bacterium]
MELFWRLIAAAGDPITGGAASTGLKCRRVSDGKLLDWSDGTFKASDWTTVSSALLETDATNLPGLYVNTVSTAAWADGWYQFYAEYTGSPKQYAVVEVNLKNGQEFETYLSAATPVSVLPFSGSVQASYAQSGATVEVIQGDSPAIPYDLATDLTGYTVWFGAKKDLSDAAYSIAAKEITSSVTDVLNGRGAIPLTTAETTALSPGTYAAEIEIRKGADVLTAMRFTLRVKGQVIV